jgi:NhaP-type Na+/H+ or K+/H+ antiporter
MDPYVAVLAGFGVVVLLTAWIPMLFKELPLSLPIFCVALGAAIFAIPGVPGVAPHPQEHLKITERLTELILIVALTGAGLKLDRPLGWTSCGLTWRLLGIAMPVTIAAIAFLGSWLLGLGLASAILLGAALAPTDPVLASDVQVGPPGEGSEDEVRFTLTAEAGFNDGLAFPFVNLAIALAVAIQSGEAWIGRWFTIDVVWKLAVGVGLGWLIGHALGLLTFRLPNRARLSRTADGFVALGMTAICYGVTEMAKGYGFLAVFVAALAFRSVERNHEYHEKLHDFSEQFERLLMMVLLVVFGGSISSGGLITEVSWPMVLFAGVTIFVVRPVIGWISFIGSPHLPSEKWVIAFFGIRGAGSAYYLAYALGLASFENPERLWNAVGLVVLISVVLHGATVTPVMRHLDRRRRSSLVASNSVSPK